MTSVYMTCITWPAPYHSLHGNGAHSGVTPMLSHIQLSSACGSQSAQQAFGNNGCADRQHALGGVPARASVVGVHRAWQVQQQLAAARNGRGGQGQVAF